MINPPGIYFIGETGLVWSWGTNQGGNWLPVQGRLLGMSSPGLRGSRKGWTELLKNYIFITKDKKLRQKNTTLIEAWGKRGKGVNWIEALPVSCKTWDMVICCQRCHDNNRYKALSKMLQIQKADLYFFQALLRKCSTHLPTSSYSGFSRLFDGVGQKGTPPWELSVDNNIYI